ncbi:MAG: glycosyltransferase [Microcoleaceae cyanobacterium]
MVDVSVVVPIYNGEDDLPGLLACLQQQTYPRQSVSYLLVDNNSKDRTSEILQDAARSPSLNQPAEIQSEAASRLQIVPLLEDKIQSSYAARNTGIRSTESEIIAFTDADCRPEPQWLEKLVEPFADARVGIVVGEIMALPGTTLLEQHADRQDTLSQKHTLANKFCPYGQTANLAIRRSVLQQVGLFRPYLTTGGDADLCWRAQKQTDYQLHFAEQAVIKHRHRSTLKSLRSQWRRYGESNRYLHELHGVSLMPELKTKDYAYRLTRWFLKEVPTTGAKMVAGKADLVDLLSTPIGLFTAQARIKGQQQAKLPNEAQEITRLP